jgi:hypothetical protein
MIQVVNDEVHNDDDLLQIIYYHSLTHRFCEDVNIVKRRIVGFL